MDDGSDLDVEMDAAERRRRNRSWTAAGRAADRGVEAPAPPDRGPHRAEDGSLVPLGPPDDQPDDPTAAYPGLRPIGDRLRLRQYLRGIWERREFVVEAPRGERRAQNQNTVLGNLWHLLNPLMLVFVYWLVFDVLLRRGESGRELLYGGTNYLGFLVAGIIPYTYSSRSMTAGARVIVKNRQIIQNITFPRAVLPLSTVITEVLSQVPALGVMLMLLVATGERPGVTWLLLVPLFALQTVFNLGLAFITGRVTFHFEDTLQILPYILRLLFYVSGIIFSIDRVAGDHPWLGLVLRLNPFAAYVELHRAVTLGQTVGGLLWAICIGWALAILVGGFAFFRAAEQDFGRV